MASQSKIKTIFVAILPAAVVIFVISVLVMPKVRENRREAANTAPPAIEDIGVGDSRMEDDAIGGIGAEDGGAEQPPLVGGDRDEHGCIGSAGYMWCAPKDKCLRIWEESCYADLAEEVQYFLADKYSRSVDEVHVTITKQETDHASGGVRFGAGGPGEGGVWLARSLGNAWEVVFDGNGSVDCEQLRQEYGFPDSILQPNFCD